MSHVNPPPMSSDESQLVEQILTDLNSSMDAGAIQGASAGGSPMASMGMNMNNMGEMPTMGSAPAPPPTIAATPLNQIKDLPANVVVEFNSSDGHMTRLLKTIRVPAIVFVCSFVLFNPIMFSMLSRYFPDVFGFPSTTLRSQLRTAFLALLVALIVAGTTWFIQR